jgi:tetratricopeptide (TPR) repeat protein
LGVLFFVFFTDPEFLTRALSDTATAKGWTPYERMLTEGRVVVLYISLLLYPHPSRLNVDYDFPLSKGLFEPPTTIFSFLLIAALLGSAIYRARKNRFVSFAMIWFFANLFIECAVHDLDLVYEHRLYLPSMGPFMILAGSIYSIRQPKLTKLCHGLCVFLILGLSYWTYERNRVWQDPVTLWEDNIKKSPNRARVHGNLGKAYLDKGEYEKARFHFEKVIELDPALLGAYVNLAKIYIDHLKQYEKARAYLLEALNRNPDYPSPYLNLGVIHLHLRELPQAIKNFNKVLELDPENHLGHFNLAAAYFNLRDYEKAVSILKKGLGIWPRSSQLYGLLGVTFYHKDRRAESKKALIRALELDPANGMALYYMKKLR